MIKYLNPAKCAKYALNKGAAVLAPLIRRSEIRYLRRYGAYPLKKQPIFIVGAPRTGSTILYQALTNMYDVLYLDNLVCEFHRNVFFGFRLSNIVFGSLPHNNFRSRHGVTKGLHSPSECGRFWYRWLPRDQHFIDKTDVPDSVVEQVRLEIGAVINYFGKPLIFKNLNSGQRIRFLKRCFPKAKFLFITRNPAQTAQSILSVKRDLGLADDEYWSIMPKNIRELQELNVYGQVVQQVYYLEKQIVEDSDLLDSGCFIATRYEDISLESIHRMAGEMGLSVKREGYRRPRIITDETPAIDSKEYRRIQTEVGKLDWRFKNGIQPIL